ncbi:penicillin-binding protein 1B [Desulfocicer vacuolatum DSM 3385]|uniref:Penicillin-binding protein 1B n=1 Tax=Desulfocicer vacuolatum DSM 3385 TaxID=1121400 RepID=A0A1W2CXK9_9BACT|nr:penicillin-binding protein 1B [Desulfocicer vacuolatum]SMC89999.1 penicillin-binding protein 1B [Desulfocicer vacuolatum DSM 3385]
MKKKILILLLMGCTALFLGYFYKFNTVVQERFQGRLWELPAQIYARPLEIYPAMHLVPDLFEKELRLMGYRRKKDWKGLENPGSYVRMKNTFDLFCRSFNFGDDQALARHIRIRIKNNEVVDVRNPKSGSAVKMVRLDPVVIGRFYPSSMEDRVLVKLDQLPPLLVKAIVAVEDRTFYTHYGIDPKSILRAMVVNVKKKRLSQGGSTLTQQLAKNFFLTREKSFVRKINEVFMAAALELHFTKEQILEAYMNEVYLGQDGKRAIHGFGLAADFYFGKSPADLAPQEMALLVGMLKGPSGYNPRLHPDRAKERRNLVLNLMADQNLLSPSELKRALAAPLNVIEKTRLGHSPFPYYLDLVKRQLLKEYNEADLRAMGLRIFTTLDPQVQLAAEQAVAGFLNKRNKKIQTGLVVTSRASNEIQALVGGRASAKGGFNRALDATRPIGSLVKPAIYFTALDRPDIYSMISRINDNSIKIKNADGTMWQPQNFDKKSHGTVTLYKALANSYNVSTVRLGMALGVDAVADTLERMGQAPPKPWLPSMLLGSIEMSPVQVARIYHTLASGGFYTPARAIRVIYTPDGERLQRYPLTIEQRLNPGAVFLLNKILQGAVLQGTGKSLSRWVSSNLAFAGKTGTSNGYRDSWFAGFSGSRLAVVWVGRDDNRSCGLTGATGALQIFGRVMSKISNAPLVLAVPENVEWGIIDPATGARTDENCSGAMSVPFIRGFVPEKYRPCTRGNQIREKEKTQPSRKLKPANLMDWLKEVLK